MNEGEDAGRGAAFAGHVIDLAERVRAREQQRVARKPDRVAYSLFLVVSRLGHVRDHCLFYLFLEGAPTMVAATSFARQHADLFGSDVSIIDLREHFENAMEVVETARHLRDTASGATVLAPSLGLGPRLLRNG